MSILKLETNFEMTKGTAASICVATRLNLVGKKRHLFAWISALV